VTYLSYRNRVSWFDLIFHKISTRAFWNTKSRRLSLSIREKKLCRKFVRWAGVSTHMKICTCVFRVTQESWQAADGSLERPSLGLQEFVGLGVLGSLLNLGRSVDSSAVCFSS
jgi:hypothetical protein